MKYSEKFFRLTLRILIKRRRARRPTAGLAARRPEAAGTEGRAPDRPDLGRGNTPGSGWGGRGRRAAPPPRRSQRSGPRRAGRRRRPPPSPSRDPTGKPCTVKKLFDIPVPPAGMLLTKLSLCGNYDVTHKLFLPRESLVSDIPAGDGNIEKLFLQCEGGIFE